MNKIYLLSSHSVVDGDETIHNYAFTTKELAQAEMRRQIANTDLDGLELDYENETCVSYTEEGYYVENHEEWVIEELPVMGENMTTPELRSVVESLAELIGKIQEQVRNGSEPVEVITPLDGKAYSRKSITFADETDEDGDKKFEVRNYIDGTTQILSREDLFNPLLTNIGKALEKNSLFYDVLD